MTLISPDEVIEDLTVDEYVERIEAAQSNGSHALWDIAVALLHAETKLNPGEFLQVKKRTGYSDGTFSKYKSIARSAAIGELIDHMPPHMSTLYEISMLDDDVIRLAVEHKVIEQQTERHEIESMRSTAKQLAVRASRGELEAPDVPPNTPVEPPPMDPGEAPGDLSPGKEAPGPVRGWSLAACHSGVPSETCAPTVEDRDLRDVGGVLEYRGACRSCKWRGPVADSENAATETAHDHTHPAWRDLPIVEPFPSEAAGTTKAAAKARETWLVTQASQLPKGWLEGGGPILTKRSALTNRHRDGGTPFGGYDMAGGEHIETHLDHGAPVPEYVYSQEELAAAETAEAEAKFDELATLEAALEAADLRQLKVLDARIEVDEAKGGHLISGHLQVPGDQVPFLARVSSGRAGVSWRVDTDHNNASGWSTFESTILEVRYSLEKKAAHANEQAESDLYERFAAHHEGSAVGGAEGLKSSLKWRLSVTGFEAETGELTGYRGVMKQPPGDEWPFRVVEHAEQWMAVYTGEERSGMREVYDDTPLEALEGLRRYGISGKHPDDEVDVSIDLEAEDDEKAAAEQLGVSSLAVHQKIDGGLVYVGLVEVGGADYPFSVEADDTLEDTWLACCPSDRLLAGLEALNACEADGPTWSDALAELKTSIADVLADLPQDEFEVGDAEAPVDPVERVQKGIEEHKLDYGIQSEPELANYKTPPAPKDQSAFERGEAFVTALRDLHGHHDVELYLARHGDLVVPVYELARDLVALTVVQAKELGAS